MVIIEHSNNHQTLYGHLSMVRYAPPWQVGNWQIGTSGMTGNSDGPHLHFEVRYRVNNEWQPKDPYGRPPVDPWQNYSAVVSEWLWVDEPARTQTPPTYNGDYILDNDDSNLPSYFTLACNAGFGTANCPFWWYVNNNGYWGDLRYTKTNGNTIDYWARWRAPNLPSTGQYEVEVYVPYWSAASRSHAVRYEIGAQNGTQVVVVDQHAVSYGTWISLGRYNFSAGSNNYVLVTDAAYISGNPDPNGNYTDPTGRLILADAVRWRKTH